MTTETGPTEVYIVSGTATWKPLNIYQVAFAVMAGLWGFAATFAAAWYAFLSAMLD